MHGYSGYPVSIHVPVQIILYVLEEKIFVEHHVKPPYTQVQADRLETIFVVVPPVHTSAIRQVRNNFGCAPHNTKLSG
jgi:hypothetical protein